MVSNQVAPIAASTRGSNAWQTFQATPDIARAILGTARQRTREGVILEEVDRWRSLEPDNPSRGSAICCLILMGAAAAAKERKQAGGKT
jgi:hypothetical protein